MTLSHDVSTIAIGTFLWDYLITLWFEAEFMRGTLRIRWSLIPYFLTRYITLGFIIGCIVVQMSRLQVNCGAVYLIGLVLGKAAVTSASVNLVIRTVVIWSYRWYIVLLLGVLITGQVILIGIGFRDRNYSATWSHELQYCVNDATSRQNLGIFAPYALFVDLVIVILTVAGLRKSNPSKGFAAVLIHQGFAFFLVVLIFQTWVTAAVFAGDSATLISISSLLCAVIVPMVSCWLVRSIFYNSFSLSRPPTISCKSSMTAGEFCRRDGVQLTTRLELGSATPSC